ncbi:MAG: type III-A CRISPR-associated protein Cas10/Csm1 [Clostridia bacterium]|nr:type III-A CRISPR-associated protein Cas10/Csm1 [Clostridia bacterium]
MRQKILELTLGCLMHDVGKLCFRAGESGNHSASGHAFLKKAWQGYSPGEAPDCVRWHHASELREAGPAADSLAYIAYAADNIAAAADRRAAEESGRFERYLPLSPVFTHLNGEHDGLALSAMPQDGTLRMPVSSEIRLTAGQYGEICRELEAQLRTLPPEEEWVNSILGVLESLTSSVPSSTNTAESPDVSLYDHMKITAAVASCMALYLYDSSVTDYRTALFEKEKEFRAKKAFLLYSADFSGIQTFIFTVSTKGALRSLRSRSFFLELTMEHYIDELLTACGVSRANLLYSGGGHCYLLLPNTDEVKRRIEAWNDRFNGWLADEFGLSLYLADGYTECSADELTNSPAEDSPYQAMFGRVSRAVAKKKLHRYSAQRIIEMNRTKEELSGRECRVCGRTDHLIRGEDGSDLCRWCSTFERLSSKIQNTGVYLVLCGEEKGADYTLPTYYGEAAFFFTDEPSARRALREEKPVLRVYTKNVSYAGLRYSTRLYVCDYAKSNSMEELAMHSQGIRRLAVCRMDVDDLGQAFVSGFESKSGATASERRRFVTISRTAAFSRQMSLFFKLYLKALLNGSYKGQSALAVAVVYSGGDDVFLVGAWNDVLEAARRIRSALKEYACGALTISGGVGLFDDHYPIRLAAEETGALEDEAKQNPGKDSVSLFAQGSGNTYTWEEFEREIMGVKLAVLENFFSAKEDTKTERGTAFLYRILDLLREVRDDPQRKVPLARLAYLLARLSPSKGSDEYARYREFSGHVMDWSLNEKDRNSLITAIYLYVYKNRKEATE